MGRVQINEDITLHDVLNVPDFKFNLVSRPKICKNINCSVIFTYDPWYLQSPSMTPLILDSLKDVMYY